jgi:hypothetical protein
LQQRCLQFRIDRCENRMRGVPLAPGPTLVVTCVNGFVFVLKAVTLTPVRGAPSPRLYNWLRGRVSVPTGTVWVTN